MKILKQKKILKKEFLSALSSAEDILKHAENMAEEIIQNAKIEAEALKQESRNAGFEQGMAEAASKIISASRYREKVIEKFKDEIIELSVSIAEQIIREQIKVNPSLVNRIFQKAISEIEDKDLVTVYVNPEDVVSAEILVAGREGGNRIAKVVRVVADDSINRGGCVIESASEHVDARIETQLDAVRKALLGNESD